ncbi:MAG TPA: hypothetical protein PLX69_24120 [Leptospiraceae bacterium]|nr:hypothetical protein [Leptospiraceae bacterium]
MKTDRSEILLRLLIAILLGLVVAYISLNNETKVYADLIIIVTGIASFVLYIWEKLKGE